jgi:hypothetical protein
MFNSTHCTQLPASVKPWLQSYSFTHGVPGASPKVAAISASERMRPLGWAEDVPTLSSKITAAADAMPETTSHRMLWFELVFIA